MTDGYGEVDIVYNPHLSVFHQKPEHPFQIQREEQLASLQNVISGKNKKKKESDHGHGHGGENPTPETLLLASVSESNFEYYAMYGMLAHIITLYAQGIDVNRQRSAFGANGTALMLAALKGHLPVVKFLIDRGANLDMRESRGQNALMWAVNERRIEMTGFLLERGADPAQKDSMQYSAYTIACQNECLPLVAMMHEHKPLAVDDMDCEGHSPLMWAVYRGNVSCVEYVHQVCGLSVTAIDTKLRRSALHWAAREGHAECCAYLLKHGTNPQLVDSDGFTALQYAVQRRHREAAMVLKKGLHQVLPRLTGTLGALGTWDKGHWLSLMYSILFTAFVLLFSLFLPPVSLFPLFTLLTVKNVGTLFFIARPIRASDHTNIISMIGIAHSAMGSFRGTGATRFRELGIFFLWIFLLLSQAGVIAAYTVPTGDVPVTYFVLMALLLFFAAQLKTRAHRDVIPHGTLQDSPVLAAVKNKEYHLLDPRVMDWDRHQRLPLRAFYCLELDHNIKKYDGWSLLMDAPLSLSNHHWFIWWVFTALALQLYTLVHFWAHLSSFCESPSAPAALQDAFVTRIWRFALNGIPCSSAVGVENWLHKYILTQPPAQLGIFTVALPLLGIFILCIILTRQLPGIFFNSTRMELSTPFVMTTSGKFVNIQKKSGYSIYAESDSRLANFARFMIGKSGRVYSNCYDIPAPTTGYLASPVGQCGGGQCSHSH